MDILIGMDTPAPGDIDIEKSKLPKLLSPSRPSWTSLSDITHGFHA
jgi:hypothetical protein